MHLRNTSTIVGVGFVVDNGCNEEGGTYGKRRATEDCLGRYLMYEYWTTAKSDCTWLIMSIP